MTDENIGKGFQQFLPQPTVTNTNADATAGTDTTAGAAEAGSVAPTSQTYYDDSVSGSTQTAGTNKNSLNSVPPPKGQVNGTSNSQKGNSFLEPNPLVTFFINFTLFSDILRQTSMAQEKSELMEMNLVNDLGLEDAAQILQSAGAEETMYIAAASADFTEAACSLAQAGAAIAGARSSSKEMDAESSRQDTEIQTQQREVDADDEQVNETQEYIGAKNRQTDLQNAQKEETATNSDPEATDQDKNEARTKREKAEDAYTQQDENTVEGYEFKNRRKMEQLNDQEKLNYAKKDLARAEDKQFNDKQDLQKLQREKSRFVADYSNTYQGKIQQKTQTFQFFATATSKFADAIQNIIKAQQTLIKGQADAQKALLDAYMQVAFKMMDTLNNAKKENSQMIAQLFQALEKFSDAEKKVGGTITAQGAVG